MTDVTRNAGLLVSFYDGHEAERILRNMLQTVQDLMADPLDQIDLNIETASNIGLDLIGERLGFARPPITDTGIRTFGFAPNSAPFGHGPWATSARGEAANLPLGPMADVNYRRMLKARGIFIRGNANRANVELALTRAFGSGNVRVTNEVQLTKAQSVALVGLANVSGELRGITAAGHRYVINPFTGAYNRVSGDLPSRVYSSLAFSEGDLFAVSGNQYYLVDWDANTLGAAVTATPLDASANVSGPVGIGSAQYMATPTSLYRIDTDVGGATTLIGAFAPATDIRALASDGGTLYAADAGGAIRTVNVTDASTTLYHRVGTTAINALAYVQGAFYAPRAASLAIVDSDIKGNEPAFSAEFGHSNAFFRESFALHRSRLVPHPAGVGFKLRHHRI